MDTGNWRRKTDDTEKITSGIAQRLYPPSVRHVGKVPNSRLYDKFARDSMLWVNRKKKAYSSEDLRAS